MRVRLLLVRGAAFAAVLNVSGMAHAQDDKCVALTDLSRRFVPEGVTRVTVDANTALVTGDSLYPDKTRLQVVLVNKNPFKFRYTTVETRTFLDAAIVNDFMKGIPGWGDDVAKMVGLGPADASCTEPTLATDLDSLKALLLGSNGPDASSERIRATLAKHKAAVDGAKKSYDAFFAATAVDPIPALQVCRQADQLRPLLPSIDLGPVEKDVAGLRASLDKVASTVESSADAFSKKAAALADKTMAAACQGAAADMKTKLKALQTAVGTYEAAVKDLKPTLTSFDDMAKLIDSSQHENAYNEIRSTVSVRRATAVDLVITKKNLRIQGQPDETLPRVRFEIGESRLFTSAGFGFGVARDRKIHRQSDANEKGELINRFGYERNDLLKAGAVVLLNATLGDLKKKPFGATTSFGLSTGIVVTPRSEDTELAYLGGVFWGWMDQFFLNVSFHAARVPKLSESSGFEIGDIVPDKLPDPLPLEKGFRPGLMLSVTYRMR